MNKVFEITDIEKFNKILEFSSLIIIDFNASWCGPCQTIKPHFYKLAEKFKDYIFLSVNTDEGSDISDYFKITALPTFVFVKNKDEIHRIRGANIQEIEKFISEY